LPLHKKFIILILTGEIDNLYSSKNTFKITSIYHMYFFTKYMRHILRCTNPTPLAPPFLRYQIVFCWNVYPGIFFFYSSYALASTQIHSLLVAARLRQQRNRAAIETRPGCDRRLRHPPKQQHSLCHCRCNNHNN
jgi:hypothetical protein